MKVMHFNTQEERLAYLKGEYEEIVPVKVEKPKKTAKKGKKKDEVPAE